MKQLIQTLRWDPLLLSLTTTGRPLDKTGFLVLLPFTLFLVRLIWHFLPAPVLCLPLTLWLWFVLFDNRLHNTGHRMKGTAIFLAVILTMATAMTFEILWLSPVRLGPLMIHGNTLLEIGPFGKIIQISAVGTGLFHLVLLAVSLTVLIVLAVLPGMGESSLRLFTDKDRIKPFALSGTLSREVLILTSLLYSTAGFLLVSLFAFMIILLEGPDSLPDITWPGGRYSGLLTGIAIIIILIIVAMKFSLLTLYARRMRSLGRSGYWALLLFPLIIFGSLINAELLTIALPAITSRLGMEVLLFSNLWLMPILRPIVSVIRSALFISLSILYLIPSRKTGSQNQTEIRES
jgi:uncharacterized membrane protein YhaH (DUF805 family)